VAAKASNHCWNSSCRRTIQPRPRPVRPRTSQATPPARSLDHSANSRGTFAPRFPSSRQFPQFDGPFLCKFLCKSLTPPSELSTAQIMKRPGLRKSQRADMRGRMLSIYPAMTCGENGPLPIITPSFRRFRTARAEEKISFPRVRFAHQAHL
jgi:hypothetical protein